MAHEVSDRTRGLAVLIISILVFLSLHSPKDLFAQDQRPNILIIITDDQRYGTVEEAMPITKSKIFDQGITFERAYVTTPACCPSRSSIMTGLYALHHKVYTNSDELCIKTIIPYFKAAGYHTGLVGKYLNSWNGERRPEFDFWVSTAFGFADYYNPRMNVQGKWYRKHGYLSHLQGAYALQFLKKYADKQPFFLMFTPNAPHLPTNLPPDQLKAARTTPPVYPQFRPENFGSENLLGKPFWLTRNLPLTDDEADDIDHYRGRQLEVLTDLDLLIGKLIDELEARQILNNTLILFMSDNGVFWGEFGLQSKDSAYEPAVHVPFGLRYSDQITPGHKTNALIANIDIAPTLVELAGLSEPKVFDGRSLMELYRQNLTWDRNLMLEGYRKKSKVRTPFRALHTGNMVYVENQDDIVELYDLQNDPYQIRNLATVPGWTDQLLSLQAKLGEIVKAPAPPVIHDEVSCAKPRTSQPVNGGKVGAKKPSPKATGAGTPHVQLED